LPIGETIWFDFDFKSFWKWWFDCDFKSYFWQMIWFDFKSYVRRFLNTLAKLHRAINVHNHAHDYARTKMRPKNTNGDGPLDVEYRCSVGIQKNKEMQRGKLIIKADYKPENYTKVGRTKVATICKKRLGFSQYWPFPHLDMKQCLLRPLPPLDDADHGHLPHSPIYSEIHLAIVLADVKCIRRPFMMDITHL
jgi:hypothetical protein